RPAAERPRAGDRRGLAGHPGGRSDRPARQLFRAGRELTRRPAARPEAARAFRGRPLGGEPVRGADRGSHGPPDRLPVGRTGGRGSAGRQWIGTGRAGEQTTGGAQESAAPGETGGWRMNRPPRRRSQAARRDNLRSVNGTRTFLLAGALALALPWGVLAQAPAPPAPAPATAPADAYTARPARFATRPVIDGKLDEPVWKTATHLGGFTQLEPKEGEPATEQTEVYLGYDADNLYIAARCHDAQPDKIVTTSLTRDADIGYHDARSAFLFATNSGGVKVDALVRNEGEQVNLDWDGIWDVAGHRDSEGWTVEIMIPFRTLRFPDKPDQLWGFNVEREVAHKQERSFWKPVEHSWYARYKMSQAGTLAGMEGAKPGGRFHFSPYVIAGVERPQNGSTSSVTRAGGDIKINLASDLVADVTIKTDFSETEADEQDVNLTRNALLFPEKRPFFLEGASLFYVGERPDPEHPSETFLFHSRTIGLSPDGVATIPILGGVKL